MSDYFNGNYWQVYGGAAQFELTYTENRGSVVKRIVLQAKSESEIGKLRSQPPGKKENYTFEYPNYAFYEKPELSTGAIEYRACDDLKNFRPFCDSVFSRMRNEQYKSLIMNALTHN